MTYKTLIMLDSKTIMMKANQIIKQEKQIQITYELSPHHSYSPVIPKASIKSEISPMNRITMKKKLDLYRFQGFIRVSYLLMKYGSPKSYLLLAYVDKALVHVEWLIPAEKIKSRYPFVDKNSYSIIACITRPDFRGRSIFPSQIQKVVMSEIPANKYLIWAEKSNIASIKAIEKSGAQHTGFFIQCRVLAGLVTTIKYRMKN